MLLYGESRFLSGCDYKRLRAVRRSPATTSAFRARQQPSGCRRQVSATGLRRVAMPPRGRWFEIVLVSSSTAPLICLHRSMYSKRADQPQMQWESQQPSPWENGYIESFNARLRDELLNGEIFYTLREA